MFAQRCKEWHHKRCLGLSEEAWETWSRSNEAYVCDRCAVRSPIKPSRPKSLPLSPTPPPASRRRLSSSPPGKYDDDEMIMMTTMMTVMMMTTMMIDDDRAVMMSMMIIDVDDDNRCR